MCDDDDDDDDGDDDDVSKKLLKADRSLFHRGLEV